MNQFAEMLSTLEYLQGLTDSQGYRDTWQLGSDSWEFDQSIGERMESVIAEYAIAHDMTWDAVNELALNSK